MNSWQKFVVVVLAAASGACEFYGTWTVWKSFRATETMAKRIKDRLDADALAQSNEAQDVMHQISMAGGQSVAFDLDKIRKANREALREVVEELDGGPKTAWGLRAFFAGAVLGVVTAVLAVAW
jgi:hypothetical protein